MAHALSTRAIHDLLNIVRLLCSVNPRDVAVRLDCGSTLNMFMRMTLGDNSNELLTRSLRNSFLTRLNPLTRLRPKSGTGKNPRGPGLIGQGMATLFQLPG